MGAPPTERDGATIADSGSEGTLPADLDEQPIVDGLPGLDVQKLRERYEPGLELGRGGMGLVSACLDRQIGRNVALKTLIDPRRAAAARTRLIREARIQGRLEHPTIVPVYDLGDDPDLGPWFTMKQVEGVTLADVLDDPEGLGAEWSPRRLLIAFMQVCRAIDFAHERGVLHRDLKPANVMLGAYGEVYVLDWGVARMSSKQRESEPSSLRAHTREGAVLGTLGYMAPEQAIGDLSSVSVRSDVYSLGSMLFELLAGVPLHEGMTAKELYRSAVLPVDTRMAVRAPGREVAPELEAIVARATQVDARQRYPRVHKLVRDLEGFLDGERDLAARRAEAGRLLEAARTATRATLGDRSEAGRRAEALGALGRVLALEPDNDEALALLLELSQAPPEQMPEEAEESYAEQRSARMTQVSRAACLAYLSNLLYVPLILGLGLGLSWPLGVFVVGVLAAAAITGLVWKRGSTSEWPILASALAAYTAYAAITALFGPLLFTPTLIALIAASYALVLERRITRAASIAAALLALGVATLAWTLDGGSSYRFVDGALLIRSRFVNLSEVATWAFLAATAVGNVLTGALAIATLRDMLNRAERRQLLEAWQLRAMGARASLPPGADGG